MGESYNEHFSCPDGLIIVDILALHTGLSAIVLCPDFSLLVNMSVGRGKHVDFDHFRVVHKRLARGLFEDTLMSFSVPVNSTR